MKQPIFGTGKPSWLKQQFGKTVAIVVGALTCILLFSAFAGRTHIGSDSENIFGFKADCLRIGNRLSFESDSESSRQEAPSFFGKEISNFKQAKSVSRSVGICISIVILATIIFTLFNMMIPELYKSIRDMIMNVPSQMNRFIRELSEMNTENSTIGNIVESVMKEATTFVQIGCVQICLDALMILCQV